MSIIDDIDAALHAVEATAEQVVARLAMLGDFGTAGPAPEDHPSVVGDHSPSTRWVDGWWADARRVEAHPGRVGGAIAPWAVGIHTCDMHPDDWDPLVNSWRTRPGDGACAHFLIGRDEAHGVLQLVSILRNGNHMGGPGHGVFDTAAARGIHPNTVAVGIELHCAGGVRLLNGQWRFVEDGKAHGAPLPDADVTPDPQRPGRGWHVIADYQRERLTLLLADLDLALLPLPAGATTRAFGEVPPAIAVMPTARVVTHWQMDPVHRSDPWNPTCEWLKAR